MLVSLEELSKSLILGYKYPNQPYVDRPVWETISKVRKDIVTGVRVAVADALGHPYPTDMHQLKHILRTSLDHKDVGVKANG